MSVEKNKKVEEQFNDYEADTGAGGSTYVLAKFRELYG